MDSNLFRLRFRTLILALAAALVVFFYVLLDLQIVHGADYLAQSARKIAVEETVPAARGNIYDRYGRLLISNRTTYQVRLNNSLLGTQRNETLRKLLSFCQREGISWTDTLPVSGTAPFVYTLSEVDGTARSRFLSLVKTMKWTDPGLEALAARIDAALEAGEDLSSLPDEVSADALVAQMRTSFEVDPALSDAEARALLGVLYEMTLRTKEVTWSEYIFAQDVDIDFITWTKENRLTGVQIEVATVRQYHTAAAAHILGRVAQMAPADVEYYESLGYARDDLVGREGVERAFESYLRGEDGVRAVEVSTTGKVVSETYIKAPDPGDHVTLTLDIFLQDAVEHALAEHVANLPEAEGAAAVVVEVSSGGVLASASYPTFDLANFSAKYNEIERAPNRPMYNRALLGAYAPGSTFKMVTAIGALEEDVIGVTDEILDTGRYTYYRDYQPMCWIYRQYRGTHGRVNISEAIRDSCNVFFYDVGRRLGIEQLNNYARLFGLGQATGIELPENTGHVAGPETSKTLGTTWNDGATLAAAIGQENNLFSPLQLANYIATLVNGGNHWPAHLLRSVSSPSSQTVLRQEPEALSTLSLKQENLDAVKRGMLEVSQSGSVAGYFRTLDVEVGAKTGSAQVSSATTSNAVFVCFAPYDDPEIAMAIVVEKGGSGSELGAIAADIVSYYFTAKQTLDSIPPEGVLLR